MPSRRLPALPVAIVGAGLMGAWHARAAEHAGARVTAIVDPDLKRAKALARQRPGCVVATSLDTLAPQAAPSVIHLCTPTATHEALTRECLTRRCHVLVEKPLAPNARITADLLREATDAKRLLCPVHQFVWQRGAREALERLDELGELVHVRSLTCSAGATGRSPADEDAIALEIVPHPLSLLERFAPGAIARSQWSSARPASGDLAVLGHHNRLTMSLVVSMHGRPTTNEMTLVGTRATVHLDLFHGFAVFETGKASRAKKIRRPFERAAAELASAGSNLARRAFARQGAYPGLWELVDEFYRAVASRAEPPFGAGEILAVANALDAIRASAFSTEA